MKAYERGAARRPSPGYRVGNQLFWTGVLLLGLTAWATVDNVLDAQQAHTLSGPYEDYVSGPWKVGSPEDREKADRELAGAAAEADSP